MKLNKIHYFSLLIPLLLFVTKIQGQTNNEAKSIFDIMNYKEVLSVTLKADFTAIDSTRRSPEKRKAELSFEDESGEKQTWNVKLITRGNYRRLRCEMVPLKIEFKKKQLKAAGLAKFDDMKLVTHCVSNKLEAKTLLQKEYLAYKLYNELTDNSYRVQLLKITYVDIKTGGKSKHWAFLIEDTAQLKSRMGVTAAVENHLNLPKDTFHGNSLKIVSTFQYMIGNSDWDIKVGRNVKYFMKDGKIIPVPYDFDFSGLVSAPYAIPNPNYNIPSVQTRVFLGFPEDIAKLNGILAYFKTKRSSLMKIVRKFHALNNSEREFIHTYLASFYEEAREISPVAKVDLSSTEEMTSMKKD